MTTPNETNKAPLNDRKEIEIYELTNNSEQLSS